MKKQKMPLADVPLVPFDLPRFSSEDEEAEWWQTHRDEAADLLERAHKAGALRLVRNGVVMTPKVTPTMQTTIRLIADDVTRARKQARRKGLRYQTYLKMLIHEGLERADKAI